MICRLFLRFVGSFAPPIDRSALLSRAHVPLDREVRKQVSTLLTSVASGARLSDASMAHLLLVDDDNDIVEAFGDLLGGEGHEVHSASTGEEGLVVLRASPLPDVLILDVDMPVLGGPGMAHKMLLHDAGEEHVPIILMSARQACHRSPEKWGRHTSSRNRRRSIPFSHCSIERFTSDEDHRPPEAVHQRVVYSDLDVGSIFSRADRDVTRAVQR